MFYLLDKVILAPIEQPGSERHLNPGTSKASCIKFNVGCNYQRKPLDVLAQSKSVFQRPTLAVAPVVKFYATCA